MGRPSSGLGLEVRGTTAASRSAPQTAPSRTNTGAPKPPTAAPGTAQPPATAPKTGASTSTAAPRTGENIVDALAGTLIKKMRNKFAMIASDNLSQEIIAEEVNAFVRRGGNIREDDIGAMEERIRARLAGETPATNTLASQKRSAIEGDEWAKIYRYQVEEGRQIAADALVKRMQARSELVETLARQKAEAAEAKKAEREYEMAYYRMEMADQKAFETECEEKVARRWAAAQKLNDERKVQQEDRDLRRRLQMELKIKEEGDTVSKLAYETRMAFEKEEQAKRDAQASLKASLLENEAKLRAKQEAKRQEQIRDQQFMDEYAAMLERQERARKEQRDRIFSRQARQAEDAKNRPEAKQWVDPALIEKYRVEKDMAAAAEERRRMNRIKEVNMKAKLAFDEQVKEKQAIKEEAKRVERERAAALFAKIAQQEEEERLKQIKAQERKLQFRETLQAQMKDNAHRKITSLMSEDERRLNADLLGKVRKLEVTGTVEPSGTSLMPLSPNAKGRTFNL